MATRSVQPDDLLDSEGVAALLGFASRNVVNVMKARHADFPAPWLQRGHCTLWLRADVEAWARSTGRLD